MSGIWRLSEARFQTRKPLCTSSRIGRGAAENLAIAASCRKEAQPLSAAETIPVRRRLTSMKPLVCAVLFLLPVAAGRAQQPPAFEGTMHASMQMGRATVPVIYQLKGRRARIDMEIPPTATTVLLDSATGQQIVLLPQLKSYLVHTVTPPIATLHPPVLTDLGRQEAIAGHHCEDYQVDSDRYVGTTCLAKDLPSEAFGGGFGMLGANSPALDTLRAAGMPLKVDLRAKSSPSDAAKSGEPITMEITSIEAHPVEDSVFAIPEGWHEMPTPFTRQ